MSEKEFIIVEIELFTFFYYRFCIPNVFVFFYNLDSTNV